MLFEHYIISNIISATIPQLHNFKVISRVLQDNHISFLLF